MIDNILIGTDLLSQKSMRDDKTDKVKKTDYQLILSPNSEVHFHLIDWVARGVHNQR